MATAALQSLTHETLCDSGQPSHARNCATTIISKFILNNFAEVLAVRARGRLHGDGCLAEFNT